MRYVRGHLQNNRILIKLGICLFRDDPSASDGYVFHEFRALVDTGASRTAISQNVINRVGLASRGQIQVGNVKRTELHDTFIFHVGIWPDNELGEPSAPFGIGDPIMGIDGGDSRYYDVLLGMDILTRGSLHLKHDATFELAFPD
jgi:gag-polyprotein putative aspartyl protease